MGWRDRFQRKNHRHAPEFPIALPIGEGLTVTIYSHTLETAAGPLECWSYVSSGLEAFGHREVIMTLKREPGEAPESFPEEPIDLIRIIIPFAKNGSVAMPGTTTECGPTGEFLRGHVMYIEAQPLPGVNSPASALAAVLITNDELRTLKEYGATRVMSRLGRSAAYYPCPPWSDRARVRSGERVGSETILERVRRVRVVGLTVLLDGQTVRIGVSAKARDTLTRMLSSWTLDLPLALLIDWPTTADRCLVWQPGLTGVNAITPGKAIGEVLGACFVLIVAHQQQNGMRIIEDGFGLLLTDESASGLRDALMNGGDCIVEYPNGRIIVESTDADAETHAQILLLNPDDQLSARGVTTGALSLYIKGLLRILRDVIATGELPESFDVYVAVRPGRRARVWNTSPIVREKLEAIQPPSIKDGPIAVGIRSRDLTQTAFPLEWGTAATEISASTQQIGVTLDEILDRVWPE